MKKNVLLLLAILSLLAVNVSASHLMGGQITVAQISGLDYEIKMQLYRDTTGVVISPSATFVVEDVNSSYTTTYVVPHTGMNQFLNGVELYEYFANLTFPAVGHYRIYWEECCRNAAIINMNPAESLHLMTEVEVYGSTANSTPVFLNPPTTLAQKNSLWQYNPLPFDIDGDSLAWLMETPLGQGGDTVANYTIPQADPLYPFTLNALTGEITWMPDSNGHWEASFLVEEFRGGVKIGEIRRDMQIIVVDDTTNYHPVLVNTGSWPIDVNGNFAMNLAPGVPITLSVTATDLDNDQLLMSVQGEPMLLTTNPAQWSVVNSAPGTFSGTFSWTPLLFDARSQPYILAFRVEENHGQNVFISDETLLLYVTTNVGVNDISNEISHRKLFPNPSNGNWNLSFELNKSSDVRIDVLDITGKKITTILDSNLPAGVNLIRNNSSNLEAGFYMVNVSVNGQKSFSTPLVVE